LSYPATPHCAGGFGGSGHDRFDHLIRIVDRLGQVEAGSIAADQTTHTALGLAGPVLPLPYTTACSPKATFMHCAFVAYKLHVSS
jgi:hypothetical protein